MNQLVPLSNNEFPVDCRDVHTRIESKRKYTTWITHKIASYGFIKGVDFVTRLSLNQEHKRGRKSLEYLCSYDMAKELCFLENTPKGREVRLFFIEIEKKFQALVNPPVVKMTAAEELLAYAQRLVDQERQLKTVVEDLTRIEQIAKQEDDTLTHEQISKMDLAINAKYKEYGNPKIIGLIKKAIKEKFFEIKGTRTYKEIPRHGFEEAMKLIAEYKAPAWMNKELQ